MHKHLYTFMVLDFSGKDLPILFLAFQDDIFKVVEISY